MVGAGGVAGSRANALVLFSNQRLIIQGFIWHVSPELLAYPLVYVLGKGFRQAIRQGLHHDGVVVIARFLVALCQLLDTMTGGYRKATDPVRFAALPGSDKVGQAVAGTIAILGGLLANVVQPLHHLGTRLVGIYLNDIVVDTVGRPQADDATRLDALFVDQLAQHLLGVGKQIACRLADHFIFKNARVLAAQLPAHEKRGPVDPLEQFFQIVVIKDMQSGHGGLWRCITGPINGQLALARLGIAQIGRLGTPLGITHPHLLILGIDLCDVLELRAGREQFTYHAYRTGGVSHVDHRLFVLGVNLYRSVRLGGRGAANQQWQRKVLALHLLGHMHHLIERGRNQARQANNIGILFTGGLQDLLGRYHDAKIDHLIIVALQHNTDDVLADIVDIPLYRSHDDLALGLLSGCVEFAL